MRWRGAWLRPSQVCRLLFLQMFSSAPTLIWVRGVTGKWNCISSVSFLPAQLTSAGSPQVSTGWCLSCLPISTWRRSGYLFFAGPRKGLLISDGGDNLWIWCILPFPGLKERYLLLKERLNQAWAVLTDLWCVSQIKITCHMPFKLNWSFSCSKEKPLFWSSLFG